MCSPYSDGQHFKLIENQFGMLLGRAMMLLAHGHSFMPVVEFAEWRRWFSAKR
jgi:hypothetical protein